MHRPGIIGARPHHGGAPYVGPLDIVPGAVVAYSQRAMSAALRGSALYTIADGAGGATQSFNSDATTGDAPSAAILSYSATPFAALWKDQSGNAKDVSASGAAQPSWTATASGGKPSLAFDGVAQTLTRSAASSVVINAASGFCVFKVLETAAPSSNQFIFTLGDGNNGPDLFIEVGVSNASHDFGITAEADDAGFSNGFDVQQFGHAGATDTYYLFDFAMDDTGVAKGTINGTPTGTGGTYGTGIVGAVPDSFFIGSVDGVSVFLKGQIAELCLYNSLLSDANQLAIRQNIAAYYNIPLP